MTNHIKIWGCTVCMEGIVESGIGEGAEYVSVYSDKIEEALSFKPFLGTLNLIIDPKEKSEFLNTKTDFIIKEFEKDEKNFGTVHCYKVIINNEVEGVLVIPVRANYPNKIIEVVSAINLRSKYDLKDGDKVVLSK